MSILRTVCVVVTLGVCGCRGAKEAALEDGGGVGGADSRVAGVADSSVAGVADSSVADALVANVVDTLVAKVTADGVTVAGDDAGPVVDGGGDAIETAEGITVEGAVVDAGVLARLPPEVLGLARGVGACRAVEDGYGAVGRAGDGTLTWVGAGPEPDSLGRKDRIGGCNVAPSYRLATAKSVAGRWVPREDAVSGDVRALRAKALGEGLTPITNLVHARCVSRKTLRPIGALAVLGGVLEGFVLDLVPSRNILTVKLVDARTDKVEVYVLGKTGVRTLEWCDRTDVAEGFCPNPAHGEVLHAALIDGQLVLTMGLGFADVCGQDDLVVKAFPMPAKILRGLAPR